MTSATNMRGSGEIKRLGPVSGEYVIEEKTYKAMMVEMRQYQELRTPEYEEILETAKETVMKEMTKKAEALGANAIIGMNMHQEIVGYGKMMIIAGDGIAAKIDGLEE